MSEPRYRWAHPSEWLDHWIEQHQDVAALDSLARALAAELDSDQLQDLFQAEMDADGYFRPLKERKP
jgi:hypothetical protein